MAWPLPTSTVPPKPLGNAQLLSHHKQWGAAIVAWAAQEMSLPPRNLEVCEFPKLFQTFSRLVRTNSTAEWPLERLLLCLAVPHRQEPGEGRPQGRGTLGGEEERERPGREREAAARVPRVGGCHGKDEAGPKRTGLGYRKYGSIYGTLQSLHRDQAKVI